MSEEKLTIKIRDFEVEPDSAFVFNSWLKSYRLGGFGINVDNGIYYQEHHKVIEKCILNGTTKIACDPANPATIYGYINWMKVDGILVINFSYVKHTFRNLGIGKELLAETGHQEGAGALFTHMTPLAKSKQVKYNLIYHPYILVNYKLGQ